MNGRFPLFDPWVWRMAWRDSRSHRRRLGLYLMSIVLGVSVLVAIRSMGDNMEAAVNGQAKELLGADLRIRGSRPFGPETEALIDSIGGAQAREVEFNSMIYFPESGDTRLVEVRAMAGGFPFYGDLVTEPAAAAREYQDAGTVLLDAGLMLQFGVEVGDSVRLGAQAFRVDGRVLKIPGENFASMTLAPRVFMPLSRVEETGLIQYGSRVDYQVYFKFEEDADLEPLLEAIRPHLTEHGLRRDTVASRRGRMGRTLGNLYNFLGLVGFVALLLGCVGVASAVHVYVRQKISTVAVLRCLGARAGQAFSIYLIQAAALGLGGSVLGALAGLLVQALLPGMVEGMLPVEVQAEVSWPAVFEGVLIGMGLTLLFALLPLLPIRRVSPLRALRTAYDELERRRDVLQGVVFLAIVLLVGALAVLQTGRFRVGAGFTAGLGAAFGLLLGMAALLMKLVRRYFPSSWRYVWRQGLANLYRPNNQTRVLMLSLGLGTFLISTLYLSQHSLMEQVSLAGRGNRSNLVMFDIQSDQVDGVEELVHASGLPVIHRAPVVTMRLAGVKGQTVEELLADPDRRVERWVLTREYRSTYRDSLFDSEEIVAGAWVGSVPEGTEPVPVSPAEDVARRLGVTLGDTLVFDVQGVPVTAVVQSLREIDWQRVQPNFWMVFPRGVLEPAPQFYVLTTRAPTAAESAALQRALVSRFPNVSVVDLRLVLQTVDEILSQVGFVIRFMALFSVLTGLAVLASAVLTSRYQRIQEGVLLRTLGASRKQIVQILLLEYLFLGALAALTGLVLAVGGGWAVAQFVFEIAFAVPGWALGLIFVLVTGLTVVVGMLNSRGIAGRPPLEVLRAEV